LDEFEERFLFVCVGSDYLQRPSAFGMRRGRKEDFLEGNVRRYLVMRGTWDG